MLSSLSFYSLLALVSLCGIVSTNPLPEAEQIIDKRQECVEFLPPVIIAPSNTPFLDCDEAPGSVSFMFQEDGNFVVYNQNHVAVWASNTGARTCAGNNCTLEFQSDGNLVEYFNRVPIWYTGTGANIGKSLYFQNTPPYLYILNSAGAIAWQS